MISDARTTCKSMEWGTPATILAAVREYDLIDLDPCSSSDHNEIVQARRILTIDDDGRTAEWGRGETIWCNPPGYRSPGQPVHQVFYERCHRAVGSGSFIRAWYWAYNIDIYRHIVAKGRRHPVWFPPTRIRHRGPNTAPPNWSVMVCIGEDGVSMANHLEHRLGGIAMVPT